MKPKRKSNRAKQFVDYSFKNDIATHGWLKIADILARRFFICDEFPRLTGHELTMEYLRKNGLTDPIIIEKPDGLNMVMPPPGTHVDDIARMIGDRPLEVMDVKRQESQEGWTLFQWAHYFSHPENRRELFNVISLEISDTPFGKSIQRPSIISEIDWIDRFWPSDMKPIEFPKVQLYCLMSPAGCWTDFHIDFGGTSVFYHLLSGEKLFYMIPPTPKNLMLYERWSKSPEQNEVFFADLVKACYRIHLLPGNTMIIPSGWIHGVYTPKDSIVIGGNFLHTFSINNQLSVYELEKRCEIPHRYRFPFYERLCWYAAQGYHHAISNEDNISQLELEQIEYLCDYLYQQVLRASTPVKQELDPSQIPPSPPHTALSISTTEKKFIRDSIPKELRKDMICKKMLKSLSKQIADRKASSADVSPEIPMETS